LYLNTCRAIQNKTQLPFNSYKYTFSLTKKKVLLNTS